MAEAGRSSSVATMAQSVAGFLLCTEKSVEHWGITNEKTFINIFARLVFEQVPRGSFFVQLNHFVLVVAGLLYPCEKLPHGVLPILGKLKITLPTSFRLSRGLQKARISIF